MILFQDLIVLIKLINLINNHNNLNIINRPAEGMARVQASINHKKFFKSVYKISKNRKKVIVMPKLIKAVSESK